MKQKLVLIASIILLALSSLQDARGQWVQVGLPDHYIYAFAVSGMNLFVGCDSGVFLSTDSGTSWNAKSDGLPFGSFPAESGYCPVQSFALIGTDLFAGIGDDSGGVFRSSDSGRSWKMESDGLPSGNPLSGVATMAVSAPDIFVATGVGVFVSTNEGAIWAPVGTGLPNKEFIYSFCVDSTHLFAGAGGIDTGQVFLSTDNGGSWNAANMGLPNHIGAISALIVSNNNIFGGIGNGELNEGAVFVTTDSGASWRTAGIGFPSNNGPVSSFSVSGTNLFAGILGGGVYFLNGIGNNWIPSNSGLTDSNVEALTLAGQYLFAGTDSGVWRRPLSDFGISAVSPTTSVNNSLTNFPNPFSQSTTISFSLSESGVAEIIIVNLLGSEVARIFSGELEAGSHTFSWDASGLPPGMYECIVRMNGQAQQIPIMLIRN
jgi:photosystem II stability/assembly factor-like uncharacterized protein